MTGNIKKLGWGLEAMATLAFQVLGTGEDQIWKIAEDLLRW